MAHKISKLVYDHELLWSYQQEFYHKYLVIISFRNSKVFWQKQSILWQRYSYILKYKLLLIQTVETEISICFFTIFRSFRSEIIAQIGHNLLHFPCQYLKRLFVLHYRILVLQDFPYPTSLRLSSFFLYPIQIEDPTNWNILKIIMCFTIFEFAYDHELISPSQ